MSEIHAPSCDDLPYGPGQSDYEYDVERQRKDDMSNEEFIATTRLEARDALALIVAARDLNPDALIPTALWVAIEAGRRVL